MTNDAFLGDALNVLQPQAGYRAGVDAVLLAATVPDSGRISVLDAGAGVGVVGLVRGAAVRAAQVTLVEREPELADLAQQNATTKRPGRSRHRRGG